MLKTNELTNFILNWFFTKGIYARRHGVSAGLASYTNKAGDTKDRYLTGGIKGGSDIFVWLPNSCKGKFLGIEIKTGTDRLRDEQIGFIKSIEAMGHLTMVVHTKEDFLNQINSLT